VNQIRNFDVPMMVFISGISFNLSFRGKLNYPNYIWKRVKRLVFPVWIFLTFLFSVALFLFPEEITVEKIISSYLFLSGIGYVWIIRVFLLVALAAPFLLYINGKFKSNKKFLIFLLISFVIYDISQTIIHNFNNESFALELFDAIVFYLIPYSLIYLLGIRAMNLTKPEFLKIIIFSGITFLGIGLYLYIEKGIFIYTHDYKYPISSYYVSYALMAALPFWLFGDLIWKQIPIKIKPFILFVSQNSIWIYLWHIPFIRITEKIHFNLIVEYLGVICLATLITYVQTIIVEQIFVPLFKNEKMKKNIRIILKG
tara:strand:+ start:2810 stop:3748 length:939 start_codon:yes stop_codon:yes gene_type:complete